jgi:superfamily II DNA or RNA helicase
MAQKRCEMSLQSSSIANLRKVKLPTLLGVKLKISCAEIYQASTSSEPLAAKFQLLAEDSSLVKVLKVVLDDRRAIEVHLDSEKTGVVDSGCESILNALDPCVDNECLDLSKEARWLKPKTAIVTEATNDFISARRASALTSWSRGIVYVEEGREIEGLRRAQIGALHAIASHWTLSRALGVVVMPTGTGKTEVMVATAVAHRCENLLVVVPSDALRTQTAKKFIQSGILRRLGVVPNDYGFPVVAVLKGRPESNADLDIFSSCNVVVATMAALSGISDDLQREIGRRCSHLFLDEAHHSPADSWNRLREQFNGKPVLQFTATPYRQDGRRLEGRFIYNYPLSKAQEDGCFRPIKFEEVSEWDDDLVDAAIAAKAVARLREDRRNGFNHLIMARAGSIPQANALYEQIYSPLYSDLNPIVIHNKTPGRRALLEAIKRGEHKIIVCVDMLGEGFDLPQLKIAALHFVHKSLAVTLQFAGRFTRSATGAVADIGDATVVANTTDPKVSEALEELYAQDADWNRLLPRLSLDAINPQVQFSEFVGQFHSSTPPNEAELLSSSNLLPKCSAIIYKTNSFAPQRFHEYLREGQNLVASWIHEQRHIMAFVIRHRIPLEWANSREVAHEVYDLFVLYYDERQKLLFIHSSIKKNKHIELAKAVGGATINQVSGECMFRVFSGLQRLTFYNIGLNRRGRGNMRYQMFTGLDIADAIDPAQQQDSTKANLFGAGYEEGNRATVGCSYHGIVWSLQATTIPEWQSWCEHIGGKLLNEGIGTNSYFEHTLVPKEITTLPTELPLCIEWPSLFFERITQDIYFCQSGRATSWLEAELQLAAEWTASSYLFNLAFVDGSLVSLRAILDDSGFRIESVASTAIEIRIGSKRLNLVDFFSDHPPLLRFADGSELKKGNVIVAPRQQPIEHFPVDQIVAVDWAGIDITVESQWKDKQHRPASVQRRMIDLLLSSNEYLVIVDDDDPGEAADVVAIKETDSAIDVEFYHCKYSGSVNAGSRANDFYQVCGQAQKSVSHTNNFGKLINHFIHREKKVLNGRKTRLERGSLTELGNLRKRSRRKHIRYHIGVVQPGISRTSLKPHHTALLGSTSLFLRQIVNTRLSVWASA